MDWITWEDEDEPSYVEPGVCVDWFRDGHPDYGCGHGVDLEKLCKSQTGYPTLN